MPDIVKSTIVVSAEQLMALARNRRAVYDARRCGNRLPIPAAVYVNMQFRRVAEAISGGWLRVYEKPAKRDAWYTLPKAETETEQ